MKALLLTALAGCLLPAADASTQEEMARLEGTWQLVSAEADGKRLPDDQARQIRVVIKAGKHTVYFGDKPIAEGVQFKVDPSKRPKQVEDTLPDGRKVRGIYELDGDALRSCVAAPDKERPTEFTGKAGSGFTLRVFKRAGLTAAEDARAIGPAEAAKRVNERVTVEMLVKATKDRLERRGEIYLDSEEDFRDEKNLGVVITRAGAAKLKQAGVADPAAHFKGKTIRVQGTVARKEGRPRIEVDDPAQIRVVKKG
jgi:uncharacterized protein (TIGR03067 family)